MRRPAGAPSRTARERGRTPGATRVASQAHRRAVAVRPATLASVVVLVAAFVVALAFVAGRGGLNVPGLGPATPSLLAVATESAIPTPTHRPTASPSVPSPSPTRTPKPTKSPAPSASPTATLAPDVLALLTPCADTPDCFQYRVRSGDNLHKIADLFGVAYTTLLSLNPEITNPSLIHVGQLIKVPPPTSP